jgi:ABC-type multidrug transport system ATPase subunit
VILLRQLAESGKMMIVTSIHQPRDNIFALFSRVLLLFKGRTAFFGPREGVVPYFEGLGLSLPPHTAPADWLLDIMVSPKPLPDGRELADAYEDTAIAEGEVSLRALGLPTAQSLRFTASSTDHGDKAGRRYATSFWYQLKILMQRQQLQSRGEVFDVVNAGQIAAVAIIASGVWFQRWVG